MRVTLKHSALALIAGKLAKLIDPPAPLSVSEWAADEMYLPDGEFAGEKIDLTRTPHLVEPMDKLGPDDPANEIGVMKCVQSGFTTALLAAIGHSICRDPCDIMHVEPTDGALTDFNSTKLARLIENSPALKQTVYPQTSRSASGSTTYEKKFPRGALNLALASSPADLRLKTIKKAFCDEIDEYEDDLDGQGDPLKLIAGRQVSFLVSGTWKRAYVSTPTVKGASKIEKVYDAGDKRKWHVDCPHCNTPIVFLWNAPFDKSSFGLKFNKAFPYEAHYVTQCCGSIIESWQKLDLYRNGSKAAPSITFLERRGLRNGWIATDPGPGKFPTYHLDALAAPFVPWEATAKEYVEAEGTNDPEKLKAFWNLYLGLPFEVKGDAPDHIALMQRAEDYTQGIVPAGALLLTAFADVQMRGIYVEVLAHAPDRQSWPIFADYLDGETTDHDGGAFAKLSELFLKEWPTAYGTKWRCDEFAVDSGWRTSVVYEWVRRHAGAKATKGDDGWGKVPLGIATDQDIDYRGRKIKGGAKVRAIGTWPLKGVFYTLAAITPKIENGVLVYPRGYCHFPRWLDENYFRQLTSEYLVDETHRGRTVKKWKERPGYENHFLDCRIGNIALAHAYVTTYTADDWAAVAKGRAIPEDMRTPDLFAPRTLFEGAERPVEPAPPADPHKDQFDRLAELNRGV